ncbi:MAG: type IX secretion system outer membrane channel protein PorV [Bacteroidota bacterium]
MKKMLLLEAVTVILIAVVTTEGFAQGESAVPFLRISPNSRNSGMGEAGAGLADDASAIFWNPAGLAFQTGQEVSLTHSNWLPGLGLSDLFYEFASYRNHIESLGGTLGASVTYLNLGEIQRTLSSPEPIGTFKSYEASVAVAYATKATDDLGVGGTFRVIYSALSPIGTAEEQGKGVGTTVSFDLSLLYRPSTLQLPIVGWNLGKKLGVGVNLSNIGPKITYIDAAQADPLPTNFRLGLAYKVITSDYNNLTAVLDVSKLLVSVNRDPFYKAIFTAWADQPLRTELRTFITSGGLEYWYGSPKLVGLRVGYFYEDPDFGNRRFMTFGAGIRYSIYGFDFSYIYTTSEEKHPLSDTLRFTLLISWGGTGE